MERRQLPNEPNPSHRLAAGMALYSVVWLNQDIICMRAVLRAKITSLCSGQDFFANLLGKRLFKCRAMEWTCEPCSHCSHSLRSGDHRLLMACDPCATLVNSQSPCSGRGTNLLVNYTSREN